jgi:hypothetical protein
MNWPRVHKYDDGIRPAGRPDVCFYCGQKVGQLHARDCNVILKLVELKITARLPDGRVFLGSWTLEEPHFWKPENSELHRNESSWCCSNLLREHNRFGVTWDDAAAWDALEALYESGDCLCGGVLRFAFVRVVDPTPRQRPPCVPATEVN